MSVTKTKKSTGKMKSFSKFSDENGSTKQKINGYIKYLNR